MTRTKEKLLSIFHLVLLVAAGATKVTVELLVNCVGVPKDGYEGFHSSFTLSSLSFYWDSSFSFLPSSPPGSFQINSIHGSYYVTTSLSGCIKCHIHDYRRKQQPTESRRTSNRRRRSTSPAASIGIAIASEMDPTRRRSTGKYPCQAGESR